MTEDIRSAMKAIYDDEIARAVARFRRFREGLRPSTMQPAELEVARMFGLRPTSVDGWEEFETALESEVENQLENNLENTPESGSKSGPENGQKLQ